jgi:glycosyltransferase involved in cell wall biosynthesis
MVTPSRRVLVVAHGHPDISTGGAEHAAHALFDQLRQQANVAAMLLARVGAPFARHGLSPFANRRFDGSERLIHIDSFDPFRLSQPDKRVVWDHFRRVLDDYRPTIVHFHHYLYFGIESFLEVRKYDPSVPIVVTLHEYAAICANNGQMIKTYNGALCQQADPTDCARCFPDRTPADFFLRERYIKGFFDHVDLFISPSQFLKDRYTAWGIPARRIEVIENGQAENVHGRQAAVSVGDSRRIRIGFFGRLTELKGIDVLLDAALRLDEVTRRRVTIEIHGAGLDAHPEAYRTSFRERVAKAGDCVRYVGPYRPDDAPRLMSRVDWVVVPSIWWENSPLVIQEAFAVGVPVIASDIGGMAEKVMDGVDGLLFTTGSPEDLADTIARVASDPALRPKLAAGIQRAPPISQTADRHLTLYDALLRQRDSLAPARARSR